MKMTPLSSALENAYSRYRLTQKKYPLLLNGWMLHPINMAQLKTRGLHVPAIAWQPNSQHGHCKQI